MAEQSVSQSVAFFAFHGLVVEACAELIFGHKFVPPRIVVLPIREASSRGCARIGLVVGRLVVSITALYCVRMCYTIGIALF